MKMRGPGLKKNQEFHDGDSKEFKQAWGTSEHGTPCNHTGRVPTELAVAGGTERQAKEGIPVPCSSPEGTAVM